MQQRIGNGLGLAIVPTAIALIAIRFFVGPISIGLALIMGAAMSMIFERWAGVIGGFRASFIGGIMVYGSQMAGGALAGVIIYVLLKLVSG